MINNKIKYRDKKQVINSLIAKIPFETCYSTDVVLESGIFSPNDPMLSILNSFLKELEKSEKDMYEEVLAKALSYTIGKIKHMNWIDQNGCPIVDKFRYFKSSLLNNVDRVKRNIAGYKWLGPTIDSSDGEDDGIVQSDTSLNNDVAVISNNEKDEDYLPF